MLERYFFLGRAERLVIAILLLLAVAGLALYAFTRPSGLGHTAERGAVALHQPSSSGEVADTILQKDHYVGAPSHLRSGDKAQKFDKRRVLDLNAVDSLTLIKVPGIGPAFARRILSLRQRLGGYYTVLQLQEVYGMDEDKFLALRGWFAIKTPPQRHPLSSLRADEIPRHLYLSWEQVRTLNRLLYRHGHITGWKMLMREPAFTRDDSIRLSPYFPDSLPPLR